jgi:flavin reductase (DIM6/NTAB) family NADH-FMN oxidoreductase RutF
MKKEAKIRPFWYSDVWLFPKLITIITSLDKDGKVNAAPYSHIMQYDVMTKNPRMIVGFRQDSHTFQNICETKEFVVNCPPAEYLDDMMETARFYPEGVNELEHTRFTGVPTDCRVCCRGDRQTRQEQRHRDRENQGAGL